MMGLICVCDHAGFKLCSHCEHVEEHDCAHSNEPLVCYGYTHQKGSFVAYKAVRCIPVPPATTVTGGA